MVKVEPYNRLVKPTHKPRLLRSEIKEYKFVLKIQDVGGLEPSLLKLRRFTLPSGFDKWHLDLYWFSNVVKEFGIRTRQCVKYIGKLRFTSQKIAHVPRNNPRKSERVYPSQSEHLQMALEVMTGW
jgi:hypothetical protein